MCGDAGRALALPGGNGRAVRVRLLPLLPKDREPLLPKPGSSSRLCGVFATSGSQSFAPLRGASHLHRARMRILADQSVSVETVGAAGAKGPAIGRVTSLRCYRCYPQAGTRVRSDTRTVPGSLRDVAQRCYGVLR